MPSMAEPDKLGVAGDDEEPDGLDCGDNSCLYARRKTGMRTNGGCRCQILVPVFGKDGLVAERVEMHHLRRALRRVGLEIARKP